MTICSPTQVRNWSRVRDGRRRFDSLTIGLHWATVALITGMFASAWASACQRPRARRNTAERPPFPWCGYLGCGYRPARVAI